LVRDLEEATAAADRAREEMRTMLAGKRVEPATIAQVVAELTDFGHLDDARYAQRFTEDRRRLDAWGNERIARRLRMLGIAAEHIELATAEAGEENEMERAVALLRRRFPQPPADDQERSRALGLLVRRGYESEAAYEAIRRYEQG
jgi:regulatory protein